MENDNIILEPVQKPDFEAVAKGLETVYNWLLNHDIDKNYDLDGRELRQFHDIMDYVEAVYDIHNVGKIDDVDDIDLPDNLKFLGGDE